MAEADPRAPGVTGWTTFSRELGDRVVVRRNHASYPAKDGKPASDHDDLMVLFAEDGRVRAEYFDNEGHVIRYEVQAPAPPGTLVFLSEARPGAPRFRLTYAVSRRGDARADVRDCAARGDRVPSVHLGRLRREH